MVGVFGEEGTYALKPEKLRNTRNPIMDKAVDFLRERELSAKFQIWEKLESYGEIIS
jgi:hypothetical protein